MSQLTVLIGFHEQRESSRFNTASPPDVRRWLCRAAKPPDQVSGLCPSFGLWPTGPSEEGRARTRA
jgi:hypothetical protein